MTAPLIEVEHLTMRFGGLLAVDDVSFSARPGEIIQPACRHPVDQLAGHPVDGQPPARVPVAPGGLLDPHEPADEDAPLDEVIAAVLAQRLGNRRAGQLNHHRADRRSRWGQGKTRSSRSGGHASAAHPRGGAHLDGWWSPGMVLGLTLLTACRLGVPYV